MSDASFADKLKSWPLYFLPHHLISRLVFAATRVQSPLAAPVMRVFAKHFGIDMSQAINERFEDYPSFNAFFTRALKDGARPIAEGSDEIASPVDGTVSQLGEIRDGRIFQAKGHDYSLEELVGGDPAHAALFEGGRFATLYLSPRDYHRIHMPLDGRLDDMIHVAGRLFSVAPHTVRVVPRLFARNERVVCLFDTESGPMAMILVGAINVAAIETVWAGLVTPPGKGVSRWNYREEQRVELQRGEEMGRFNMGSTVILLFNDSIEWDSALREGSPVTMGRAIAHLKD